MPVDSSFLCAMSLKFSIALISTGDWKVVASFASLWNILDKLYKCMHSHSALCSILFHFQLNEIVTIGISFSRMLLDNSEHAVPATVGIYTSLSTLDNNSRWDLGAL